MSGVLTTVMLVWLTLTLLERWRWEAYLVRLKAEPGIVVVSTDKAGGKHIVRGLRDPLAADPVALLQQTPIPPHQVIGQWEPYQSLAPTFILARAHAFLAPPEGVTLHFADGILSAVGVAPAQWISEARKLARAIAGVTKLNEEGLLDADAQAHALKVKELQAAKESIERHVLYFVLNSTDFVTPQDQVLASLVATFQTLVAATHFVGYEVQVDVVGYTDRTGLVEKNRVLGQQRAERVVAALVAQGLTTGPGIVVRARGGNLPPEQGTDENLAADRRVTFVVTVTDSQKKPR
jgi:outer membrane protein OmpA-like peptidoglycan-associated protein